MLGSVIFILDINDLPKALNDMTLAFKNTSYETLNIMCNDKLKNFHSWSVSNRLFFKYSKTFPMIFGSKPLPTDLDETRVSKNVISFSQAGKFLGIHIETNIKFNFHSSCIQVPNYRNPLVFYASLRGPS